MDGDRDTAREKAGPNNGTKSFTASSSERRKKRQLKRKFFLFITSKTHPEHIKFLLWNSSLRVPLIPPIIIFLCVFSSLNFLQEAGNVFVGNTAKTFTSYRVFMASFLCASCCFVSFLSRFWKCRKNNWVNLMPDYHNVKIWTKSFSCFSSHQIVSSWSTDSDKNRRFVDFRLSSTKRETSMRFISRK